jgi:putative transcriptional regulator
MRGKIATLLFALAALSANGEARPLPTMPAAMDGGSVGNAGATFRPAAAAAPAAGMFLVARRELLSPAFSQSVVLLLRHDESGTLGVIVNRRTRFRLHELLPDLKNGRAAAHSVFIGGPVAPQALVMLMRREKPAAGIEPVTDEIVFSAERKVLEALIARNKPPADLRLYIGYAGWAAGQLDAELARRSWFVVQASAEQVFSDGEEDLWERLIDRLDPPGIRVRQRQNHGAESDHNTYSPRGFCGGGRDIAAH